MNGASTDRAGADAAEVSRFGLPTEAVAAT
jgi:hypothetical protein